MLERVNSKEDEDGITSRMSSPGVNGVECVNSVINSTNGRHIYRERERRRGEREFYAHLGAIGDFKGRHGCRQSEGGVEGLFVKQICQDSRASLIDYALIVIGSRILFCVSGYRGRIYLYGLG